MIKSLFTFIISIAFIGVAFIAGAALQKDGVLTFGSANNLHDSCLSAVKDYYADERNVDVEDIKDKDVNYAFVEDSELCLVYVRSDDTWLDLFN